MAKCIVVETKQTSKLTTRKNKKCQFVRKQKLETRDQPKKVITLSLCIRLKRCINAVYLGILIA